MLALQAITHLLVVWGIMIVLYVVYLTTLPHCVLLCTSTQLQLLYFQGLFINDMVSKKIEGVGATLKIALLGLIVIRYTLCYILGGDRLNQNCCVTHAYINIQWVNKEIVYCSGRQFMTKRQNLSYCRKRYSSNECNKFTSVHKYCLQFYYRTNKLLMHSKCLVTSNS